MKLTLETAKALQPGGRIKDHNPATRGLELRARGTVKSWHLYYVFEGKERRPKLGEFPQISIDEARRVAGEWRKLIARGADPSAERQQRRVAPTVNDLCDHYMQQHAERRYKGTTLANVKSLLNLYVRPELGHVRVADVTPADINRMSERIAGGLVKISAPDGTRRPCKPSQTNANRARAYLSKAFSLAEGASLQWRPRNSNPCRDVETIKFSERKRRTHLAGAEFKALFIALQREAESNAERVAALLCSLFCGSRITEMAVLRRDSFEIDQVTGAVFAVLADHKTAAKTGEHRLHITAPAFKLMEALPRHDNGYVFGGLAEMKSPRRAVWDVWERAREASGIRADIQPRDLRRTFASVAKSEGASLEAIGELLRHENSQTTERYAFLFAESARKLAEGTAGTIERLMIGDL